MPRPRRSSSLRASASRTGDRGRNPPSPKREARASGGPAVVLNDEAHHTHDEHSGWNDTIRRLHAATPGGLAAQLDFTATPRHTKGQLFSWTVYDYPLKQAILDGIVKRPLKGVAKGIAEQRSEVASTRYQAYLAAGAERWKEYRDQLAPLARKPETVRALGSNVAAYVTVTTFVRELRKVVVEELEPRLLDAGRRLSETPKFPWSRATLDADRCVFNRVPCENEFEKEFARFLQHADDVDRFAKLPERFRFVVEYTDAAGNLRYYEPDFVAVTGDGAHHLVETKGLEDVNVAHKDRAATLWCENAAALTGTAWAYVKVRQGEFKGLRPTLFADLRVLAGP